MASNWRGTSREHDASTRTSERAAGHRGGRVDGGAAGMGGPLLASGVGAEDADPTAGAGSAVIHDDA